MDLDINSIISLVSACGGILVSSKMSNYRIQQLEKKVDKHNNFAERLPVIEEKLAVANHRIDDLEKQVNK
jgi:hypothetical protein